MPPHPLLDSYSPLNSQVNLELSNDLLLSGVLKFIQLNVSNNFYIEAIRGAGAQSVTVKPTGCGFDPHSRRWNIYLNLYFHFFALVSTQSPALSSATQHTMPPEFERKSGLGFLCPYPAVCGIQREADLFLFKYNLLILFTKYYKKHNSKFEQQRKYFS